MAIAMDEIAQEARAGQKKMWEHGFLSMAVMINVERRATIGKTVNRNITQNRIDWELNKDSEACRFSPLLDRRRCR